MDYEIIANRLDSLEKFATRQHREGEDDPWYSCPKSPEGSANDSIDHNLCNCGADSYNKQLKEDVQELRELIYE